MQKQSKKLRRLALIAPLLLMLPSCNPNTSATDNATACSVFPPITFSKNDTAQTKTQILQHDAVYDAICKTNP